MNPHELQVILSMTFSPASLMLTIVGKFVCVLSALSYLYYVRYVQARTSVIFKSISLVIGHCSLICYVHVKYKTHQYSNRVH